MSFKTIAERDSFIRDLAPLISQSFQNCISACPNGYLPQEPDFIAFLVRDLTQDINNLLKKYFSNGSFQTQGIFCHQSPKVKFLNLNTNQNNCAELGDLLIVYTESINNKNPRSSALLLQAKCVSSTPHTIGANEQHQLFLYEKWPTFIYVSPSDLKGKTRSIKTIPYSEGSNYLLLSKNGSINYLYVTSIPNNPLFCRYALASAIGKMINFESDSGRPFIPSISEISGDDWSNMINDLIKVAKTRLFNRKNINIINGSRINCLAFMSDNQYNDELKIPVCSYLDDFSDLKSYEDFSGVSTIIIYADLKEEKSFE